MGLIVDLNIDSILFGIGESWLAYTSIWFVRRLSTGIANEDRCILDTGWFKHKTPNSFRVQCPRRFWEMDPEILHTRLMCPCRAFTKGIFLFFFVFSLEIEDPFKIQISQKMQKPKHLAKKKRKNSNSKRLGKGILNTLCKISGSISQKRRGHWTLKEFGVLCFVKK